MQSRRVSLVEQFANIGSGFVISSLHFCEVVSRMSRVQRLRSMGMDWAADLIEGLMTDKLKLQLEVARLKRELRELKGKK